MVIKLVKLLFWIARFCSRFANQPTQVLVAVMSMSLTAFWLYVLCYLASLWLPWTRSQLCSLSKYDRASLEPKPSSGIIHLPVALPAPSDHRCAVWLQLLTASHCWDMWGVGFSTQVSGLTWINSASDYNSNHGSGISTRFYIHRNDMTTWGDDVSTHCSVVFSHRWHFPTQAVTHSNNNMYWSCVHSTLSQLFGNTTAYVNQSIILFAPLSWAKISHMLGNKKIMCLHYVSFFLCSSTVFFILL